MEENIYSIEEIKEAVARVVTKDVLAEGYTATVNSINKCINKIGAQVTIKGEFPDRLMELDGGFLPLGKIIEEFYSDLPKVIDYDRTGANVMKRQDPHYRPAYYSYPITRKTIKSTKPIDEFEAACSDPATLATFVASVLEDINRSYTQYKYSLKRQLIGSYIEKAVDATGTGSVEFATKTNYKEGAFVNDGTTYAVVAEEIPATNETSFADLLTAGSLVALDLIKTLAKPTDTATGEAFVKAVQDDVEIAEDMSNGHCLNGGAIGATSNLKLYMLKGIKSSIKVDTLAGAFNREDLDLGVEVKTLPDFGKASSDYYAILCDARTFALWQSYEATRSGENGEGDFINFWKHSNFTAFASRNTFVRIYKAA